MQKSMIFWVMLNSRLNNFEFFFGGFGWPLKNPQTNQSLEVTMIPTTWIWVF